MQLYNTLSQELQPFTIDREPVSLYVCGITPYDTTHLGHAFTYLAADVLVRYLAYRDHSVRYVQNVTDIDDDILREAKEQDVDWKEWGNRWTAHFIRDMRALNVRPPDHFPRATETIPDMIEVIERLLEAGLAYRAGGNVYFEIAAWPEYGQLCRLSPDDMLPIANQRGNDPDDPHKRNPLDFVLWQAPAPGEPGWPSPWGRGRPGWHIECSTMATKYLGEVIDVHAGGDDLCFPHHESEIAQAEGATGREPFARFWLHVAMVRHDGEKMSKSLGNLVMVRDLLEEWSPDALRLYLAGHHYRQAWSHDPQELKQAQELARTLRAALESQGGGGPPLNTGPAQAAFHRAMDDDLDTPLALMALEQLAAQISQAAARQQDVRPAQGILRAMGRVFGLRLDRPGIEEPVLAGWNRHLSQFSTDGIE